MKADYETALTRLQQLECPTGKLEDSIVDVLAACQLAQRENIHLMRNEAGDRDGAQAYRIDFADEQGTAHALMVFVNSGDDDYVARVTKVTLLDYKNY